MKHQDKPCECGCGETARRRFLPGHDARLRGRLLQQARMGRTAKQRQRAAAELEQRGWTQHQPERRHHPRAS